MDKYTNSCCAPPKNETNKNKDASKRNSNLLFFLNFPRNNNIRGAYVKTLR